MKSKTVLESEKLEDLKDVFHVIQMMDKSNRFAFRNFLRGVQVGLALGQEDREDSDGDVREI